LGDDFDKGFTGWEEGGVSRRLSQRLLTWMQEHTSNVMLMATVISVISYQVSFISYYRLKSVDALMAQLEQFEMASKRDAEDLQAIRNLAYCLAKASSRTNNDSFNFKAKAVASLSPAPSSVTNGRIFLA
jgi:hypothetical protein